MEGLSFRPVPDLPIPVPPGFRHSGTGLAPPGGRRGDLASDLYVPVERAAQGGSLIGGKIDFVIEAVKTETRRSIGRSALQIGNKNDLYLLRYDPTAPQ